MAAVKDTDKGWRKMFEQSIAMESKPHVIAGVIGSHSDTGFEQVEIAGVHEFGSAERNIPERSFIRSTFDEQERTFFYSAMILMDKIIIGRTKLRDALEQLGFIVQNSIVEKITTLKTPPLSPKTIAAKGSTKPLIDEGRLRASISFEVKRG